MTIPDGHILIARKYLDSAIAHAPPLVQVIFLWLLLRANHSDRRCSGRIIKRGQCFTSYREIREGLFWMVGFRKEKPTKHQCENAMKWLRNATMVATHKTTRGFIITICNYDYYQRPKNYKKATNATPATARTPQGAATINNRCKHSSIESKERALSKFEKPTLDEVKSHIADKDYHVEPEVFYNFYESNGWRVGRNPMKNWQAAVAQWDARERKDNEHGKKNTTHRRDFNYAESDSGETIAV